MSKKNKNSEGCRRIVEAAARLVSRTGPSVLSMRDVAEKAGVSLGTISYYFDDKDELLEHVLDGYYRGLDEFWAGALEQLHPAEPLSVPEMQAIVRGLFRTVRGMRNLARLRIMLSMQVGQTPQRRLYAHLDQYVESLARSFPEYERTELSLRMYSIFLLIARWATMHTSEWRDIVDADSDEQAERIVEEHVLTASLSIVQQPNR